MGSKILKRLAVSAASAALVFASVSTNSALAQSASNSQLSGSGVISKFSAGDVGEMLAEFEIETALAAYAGGPSATMLAATSGGGRFIISLLVCDDLASAEGCQRAYVFTAVPNAGFAYEDLNEFNMNSDVTKAVNIAEQNMIVFGTPIYSGGGIGRENFKLLMALFLNDMQNFANAQEASAAEVSFEKKPDAGGKLANIQEGNSDTAPSHGFDEAMIEQAKSAAVANTWKVKFRTNELDDILD